MRLWQPYLRKKVVLEFLAHLSQFSPRCFLCNVSALYTQAFTPALQCTSLPGRQLSIGARRRWIFCIYSMLFLWLLFSQSAPLTNLSALFFIFFFSRPTCCSKWVVCIIVKFFGTSIYYAMVTSYLDKQCIFLTLISVAGKRPHNSCEKKGLGEEKKKNVGLTSVAAAYHNSS